ncbi:uncharacterized protein B0T15DRAFT_507411 [Chaetomium strumarium]|uniref:Uncharacterized protein n=1 Tax=Chaetomium strumarium TaxID=1170767 RepID=A0AAJ0H2U6_9PEZI|nr:hypothetical protein B0T15DRAFT_507411 [Chaetomium strumarium]
MPPQTSNATAASTGTAVPGKRFELPALEFKFGSLTDGTDIPPPLPSPVQEKKTAPATPDTPNARKPQQEGRDVTDRKPGNASPSSQLSGGSPAGSKRHAEDAPASPTLSSRPASIRRLLSRNNLMHQPHANGDGTEPDGRPQSRGNTSVADSRKAKRLSGWFGRLRGNESAASKPASPLSPTSPPVVEDKKPKGPPPPKIPELSKLGIQADSGFGSDLFKDIK